MPELPEVETVVRALAARLVGQRIAGLEQRREDLRFPLPKDLPKRLAGRRLLRVSRRAKFIQGWLDDGQVLLLHLGMSGRLLFDGPGPVPHEHLTFGFEDGTRLRFVDPRRFGMLDLCADADLQHHLWLLRLGHEPLEHGFDGRLLLALFQGRHVAVKTALMDQRLVVGIGNIYASEALHRAGVSPRRLAMSVGPGRADRLAAAVRAVLFEAIEAGGSSLRDYVQASGELGSFQRQFRVYDRAGQPCLVCMRPIRRTVQTGRATYFCGGCQR